MKVNKKNGTERSKYIWEFKNNNTDYIINWNILHHIGKVRNPQRICRTCTYGKMEKANADGGTSLNRRNELNVYVFILKSIILELKKN